MRRILSTVQGTTAIASVGKPINWLTHSIKPNDGPSTYSKKHNDVQKCPEQERRSEQIPMKQNACMATVEATPPLQPENSGL